MMVGFFRAICVKRFNIFRLLKEGIIEAASRLDFSAVIACQSGLDDRVPAFRLSPARVHLWLDNQVRPLRS